MNAPSIFIAALLTIAKIWKQPKCPSTDEEIKKMWCIYIYKPIDMHTYSVILPSHKKDAILLFVATWVDMEDIVLSEISQTEKDKYWVITLMCRI